MTILRQVIIWVMLCVGVLQVDAQADITADVTSGCTPLRVKFALDPSTVDLDTVESVTWNFGFGDDVEAIDPDTVVYLRGGSFTVGAVINGDRNNPVIKNDFISSYRTISAAFTYEEYAQGFNYRFIPVDQITDADGTYTFTWEYIDTEGADDRVNIESGIDFTNQARAIDTVTLDTGIYQVILTVVDEVNGCVARSAQRISVSEDIILPNVFFFGEGRFFIIDPRDINTVLYFQVFNRYGLKVFEQTAPVINWNGETNWGRLLTSGVYYYILEAVEGDPQERYSQTGFIHLYPAN